MNIDHDALKFWAWVAVSIGTILYTWIATRDKDNSAAVNALGKKVDNHESRLTRIETVLEHLPTHDEFSELKGDVREMKAAQEGFKREMEKVNKALGRIEDFLLENAKRN